MKNLNFLSLFLALSFTATASELKVPTAAEYLGGKALCDANSQFIQNEKGFFTTVPVDYTNPKRGQFEVYAWFQGGFNPNRPTLAYFTGGPGQVSHWGQKSLIGDYNLLMIDQRGIACSRPRTYADYLSPDFYSSKNVALDLEEIRKSLKLEKMSVYGVSYGTIPATIYGSLFPKTTTSVILEGVAYDAETLWNQERRKDIVVSEVELSETVLHSRLKSIHLYGVEDSWFFNWAHDQLMRNGGRKILRDQFNSLTNLTEFNSFVEMIKTQYGPGTMEYTRNELFLLNEVPYFMIACQEMGVLEHGNELTWTRFGQAVEVFNPDVLKSCQNVKAKTKVLYKAKNFPITVPVFYFQGENDSATEASGAFNHYQTVAQGTKQFLLLEEGGHNPNLEILRGENAVAQKEIMLNAINGIKSSEELIERANADLVGLKWKLVP